MGFTRVLVAGERSRGQADYRAEEASSRIAKPPLRLCVFGEVPTPVTAITERSIAPNRIADGATNDKRPTARPQPRPIEETYQDPRQNPFDSRQLRSDHCDCQPRARAQPATA